MKILAVIMYSGRNIKIPAFWKKTCCPHFLIWTWKQYIPPKLWSHVPNHMAPHFSRLIFAPHKFKNTSDIPFLHCYLELQDISINLFFGIFITWQVFGIKFLILCHLHRSNTLDCFVLNYDDFNTGSGKKIFQMSYWVRSLIFCLSEHMTQLETTIQFLLSNAVGCNSALDCWNINFLNVDCK
jgi:hypothetical protein